MSYCVGAIADPTRAMSEPCKSYFIARVCTSRYDPKNEVKLPTQRQVRQLGLGTALRWSVAIAVEWRQVWGEVGEESES